MRTPFFPITFAGDGTKKSFQLDFNAMDPSDYRVTVDGTLKTLGTDYGIGTPTQDSYYPTVNFTTAPGNGTAIAVTRRTPIRQRKFGVESSRVGDAIQALYRQHRPMVERTIAWLTRGARRVPYRGVAKNDAWLHHRAAALNLRRLLNLGLTLQNTAWTLA